MIKIFDRKFEYHALSEFPEFFYWQLKDFYTNWLIPPLGIGLKIWINTICEIVGNYLDIRVAEKRLNDPTSTTISMEEMRKELGL